MQRRLNLRLLLWSIGGVIAFGIGINLLHGYQVQRNAHVLLERGKQALAKQELEAAVSYYGQYLSLAPHDVDARETFVFTLDKMAREPTETVRVVLRLEDLVIRDPQRHEARARLARNLMALNRFQDAIVHLHFLLSHRAEHAEWRHWLGACQAATGASDAAVTTLKLAIDQDPGRVDTYLLLADVLQHRLAQDDEASKVIDAMVLANPKNPDAYLARSRFAQQRGERDQAGKDLRQAVALAPDNASVLLAAAARAENESQPDEARRHLQRGLELHPDNTAMIKALANLELRAGKPAEATRILRTGITKAAASFELYIQLADLLIDDRQFDEATQLIATMTRAGLPPTFPNYLQARLAVERHQWNDALALLEKVRGELGVKTEWSSRVHALLGACYEQVGSTAQQLAAWQQAVQIEPGWMAAKYGLGAALLAAGRLEEAMTELDAVSKASDAPPQVWPLLARAQLQTTLRRPESLRDWTALERSLTQADKVEACKEEAKLLRADMLAARRSFAAAGALLNEARVGSKNLAFWTARAGLEAYQGHVAAGLKILDDAAAIFGDHVDLRVARSRLHGIRAGDDDRDALHALAKDIQAYPPEAQVRLLRALADTWQFMGDAPAAEQIWRQTAQAQPSDEHSRALLMEAALQRGDVAQAKQWVAELRKLEGASGSLWRWGELAIQVHEARGRTDKLADARMRLAELGRRHPDWSRVPLLAARIDEIEGKWERVIEHGVKAVELGERQPRLVRHLVQLLLERRLVAQAEQVLFLYEQKAPLPADLARQAAEIAALGRNELRLRQLMARLFPALPRDYRDLIWLASLHARIDEPTKAEACLRKAVDLAGHVPDTWIALVEHLARTGQQAAVEPVFTQMRLKMPAARLPFALARCRDAAGDPARAAVAYAEALAGQPRDFVLLAAAADFHWRADEIEKAALLYERLVDVSLGAPPDVVAAARRQLALCRLAAGNPTQAVAALDANRAAFGDRPEDRRVRWFIEGQDPARRRQATQELKDSFARYPSQADEELLLIRLDEAAGEAARARDQLAQFLTARQSPQTIALHVRLLLATESVGDALVWFARLERWEPNSPRTQELKQLVLKAKEKG